MTAPAAPAPARVPLVSGSLRSVAHLGPGRPDLQRGLRVAAAVGLPLALGVGFGVSASMLLVGLGALNCAMADPGGARSTRWRMLGVATAVDALAFGLGAAVGIHLWSALPAVAVVAWAAGMVTMFGPAVAPVGLTGSALFLVGIGFAGGPDGLAAIVGYGALGGLWAIVVVLVILPGSPLDPGSRAVARSFGLIGGLLSAINRFRSAAEPDAGRAAMVAAADAARHGVAAAHEVLGASRPRTSTQRSFREELVQLADVATRLLARVESTGGVVAETAEMAVPGSMWSSVRALLDGLAARCSDVADTVDRRRSAPTPDPVDLDPLVAEVDRQVVTLRDASGAGGLDRVDILRPLYEGLRNAATLVRSAAAVATGTGGPGLAGAPEGVTTPDAGVAIGGSTPLGPRVMAVASAVRANCTFDSFVFRRSLRFAVTAVVGLWIGTVVHLDKPYWITVTIAVILQPRAAVSLQRALLRVSGTTIGAVLAAVVLAGVRRPSVLVGMVALFAFLTFATLALNYGLGVVFLTPLILLMPSVSDPGDWHLAVSRIVETLIGAALVVVGGLVLWPSSERRSLARSVADAIGAERSLLEAVLEVCTAPAESAAGRCRVIGRLHEAAALALDNAQSGLDRWMGDLPRDRARVSVLWSLTEEVRTIFLATTAIENHLGDLFRAEPPEGLAGATRALDAALDELAASLGSGRRPAPTTLRAVRSALRPFSAQVDRLRTRREGEIASGRLERTETAMGTLDHGLVEASLRQICDALDRMADDAGYLAGPAPTMEAA